MQPAAPTPQQSLLMYFIQTGGFYLLLLVGLALLLTIWGLINLAFVKNRYALVAQALLSLAPLALEIAGLVAVFVQFRLLAAVTGPGDPRKVADLASIALLLGWLGSISTAIPAFLGILALARNVRPPAKPIDNL